jgi:uncharacterized protein YecE (DUF72 family)
VASKAPTDVTAGAATDLFGMPVPAASPATRRGTAAQVRCEPVITPPALLEQAAQTLPAEVYLGTSSWSFPGWRGLLYEDSYTNTQLARDGLSAYAASPLLRSVGIDRSFYAPLSEAEYRAYAEQVSPDFRFVVKAPARVCDAVIRGPKGTPAQSNPDFLDAALAIDTFVRPCLDGLGQHAGALVFQLSPLPDAILASPQRLIEKLARFFAALPPPAPACYALEIRDAALLTPRLIRMLREQGVRYCIGVHSRMPDVARQAAALALLDADGIGPLVVRWSLHGGLRYEGAKARYEPFDAIVDADPETREALAALIARTMRSGQASYIIVNNKAEGSSPLSCAWLALAIAEVLRSTTGVPTSTPIPSPPTPAT